MTHENQCGIELLVVLLDVAGVVLGRLSLVYLPEVDVGIVGLDGLGKRSGRILRAESVQESATQAI